MTDPLVAFLSARLDEDEAAARAADDSKTHIIEASSGPLEEHLSRWLPNRVLREIKAKREILEAHYRPGSDWCPQCDGAEPPCTTVLLLALPYADHPDYRDEWRPE